MGLKAISDGKLAVLLLSGGQVHRTRWTGDASSSPKLPSKLHKKQSSCTTSVAIVACVPKKVHIEGAGETGFKISSIEITDAIKAVDWMNLFSQSLRSSGMFVSVPL
ncbi:hypothetical protein JHK82_024758 [Glycine max]|nr:hypothetical protein JHK86_024876 [Glycine max]KAG5133570.1 hypothetical protein JHK82_024758 [Glycine max]